MACGQLELEEEGLEGVIVVEFSRVWCLVSTSGFLKDFFQGFPEVYRVFAGFANCVSNVKKKLRKFVVPWNVIST